MPTQSSQARAREGTDDRNGPPQHTAQDLQRKAELWEAIVAASEDPLESCDLDGVITSWNPAAERMFGWTAAEIVGRSGFRLIAEDRRDKWRQLLDKVAKGERILDCEMTRLTKAGDAVELSMTITPLVVGGRIVGASVLARDVLHLKRAAHRFQLAVDASPSAMIAVDEAGSIVLVNREAERLFGYSKDELLGKTIESLVPMRFRGNHPRLRAQYLTEQSARRMGSGRELFAVRKDGSEIPVEVALNPIETPEGVWTLSAIIDITERLRAQAALREAEARYRDLYEQAPDMYVAIEPSTGIILECNSTTTRKLGYSREQLIGRSVYEIYHPRCHSQVVGAFAACLHGDLAEGVELELCRADGGVLEVSMNSSTLRDDGGRITEARTIWRDISDRRQTERALEVKLRELARSNADLEQFAYVASHDLQEPLRMIASYTELLGDAYRGQLDESADRYICYAVDGARRMQKLIHALLEYARLGSEGATRESVDLDAVIDDVRNDMRVALEEAGADLEAEPLPTIRGNRAQLSRLFQNLIGNALKFRGKERPEICISGQKHGNFVVVSVRDNGIGIEPQYSRQIFEIFKRLHSRQQYPGSGMGLAIAKKIVEFHGGRIWVESQLNQGATFYFSIPA